MSNIKFTFCFFFLPLLVVISFFHLFFSLPPPLNSLGKEEIKPKTKKTNNNYNCFHQGWKRHADPVWETLNKLTISKEQTNTRKLLWLILFGLQEIKLNSNTTYRFDQLALALRDEIYKQKVDDAHVMNIDFTQICGVGVQQLLQLFPKGKAKMTEVLRPYIFWQKDKYWTNKFLNSIRPSLKKMQSLGLTQLTFDVKKFSSASFSQKRTLDIKNLVNPGLSTGKLNLDNLSWREMYKMQSKEGRIPSSDSQKITPDFEKIVFHFSADNANLVINDNINTAASPWLKVLQKTNFLGLSSLEVDKTEIDVSSFSKVQKVSNLSLEQLQIIKKFHKSFNNYFVSKGLNQLQIRKNFQTFILAFFKVKTLKKLPKINLKNLESIIWTWIDETLNSYKIKIQSTLENFATSKVVQIKINETIYQVDLLLKNDNLKLTGAQLLSTTLKQLLPLFITNISSQKFTEALRDSQIETYLIFLGGWVDWVDWRNALREYNISEFKINDQTYFFTELTKPIKSNQTVYQLSSTVKNELLSLARVNISFKELIKALENAKLEIYYLTIVDNLNTLKDKNISEIQIDDTTYTFTELSKLANENKTIYSFSDKAKIELKILFKNKITKVQLNNALNETLATNRKIVEEKEKKQHMLIGLATTGAVLALSSFGGFLYWSLKIKKNSL